ncbi:hypothetical protein [Paenibacillus aestuarii]|uniref:HEAT repeat domain-containing protein n=1 Tax=Paenibacillus aestuarii TaxID=516965 RepID=A0ABW0K3N5_9BACL|nr:hypothetical protein [Paenibacillus aestuarii]
MTGKTLYTLLVGVVLFGLLASLYLVLLVRKLRAKAYAARREHWIQDMNQPDSPLARFLAGEDEDVRLIPRQRMHVEALEDIFSHRLKLLCSAKERERIALFAGQHFTDLYRQSLRKSRWSMRMNTLLYIEMFRMTNMKNDLLGHLARPTCTPQERFTIYRIMSVFHDEIVHELLLENPGLPPSLYRQMLYPLPLAMLERYIRHFEQTPPWLQPHVLDVLRVRNERTAALLELLEKLLEANAAELRIRALKGLAAFGDMSQDTVNQLLADMSVWQKRDWPERLMLVRLMGSIREPGFLPYLDYFIGDGTYLVRSEAATSIAQYRGGKEHLHWLALHHTDRFAREMAEERRGPH